MTDTGSTSPNVPLSGKGKTRADRTVQGITILFLIDTGATLSTLDQELVEQYRYPVSNNTVCLSGREDDPNNTTQQTP